jgi:hypothetical protein
LLEAVGTTSAGVLFTTRRVPKVPDKPADRCDPRHNRIGVEDARPPGVPVREGWGRGDFVQ